MSHDIDRGAAEAEFRIVFSHLGAITAYADAAAAPTPTRSQRRS